MLIIGFSLIGIFFIYEWLVPKEASIPWDVVSNRTSVSAYVSLPSSSFLLCSFFRQVYRNVLPRHHQHSRFLYVYHLHLCGAFHSSESTDYLPVYFQACKGASPIRSSVDILPITLVIAPFAFTAGTLIQITQKYRWASVVAWSISLIGFGLLSTLDADSSTGKWAGYQIVTAAGIGLMVRLLTSRNSLGLRH